MQEQSWHTRRGKCAHAVQSVIISITGWLGRTLHVHVQTHLLSVHAVKDAAATNSQPGFCVAARRPNYNLHTDRNTLPHQSGAHTPNLVIGSRRERRDSDKSSIQSVVAQLRKKKKKLHYLCSFTDRKR